MRTHRIWIILCTVAFYLASCEISYSSHTSRPPSLVPNMPGSTSLSTPLSTSLVPEKPPMPLFNSFENEVLQGVGIHSQNQDWRIIEDGNDNHVFQIDNKGKSDWPVITLGSAFTNGVIDFRVKLIEYDLSQDNGSGIVNLGFRNTPDGGYVFALHPAHRSAVLKYTDPAGHWSGEITGGTATMLFEPDTWYSIRIVAYEDSIEVLINGRLMVSASDDHFQMGDLSLGVGPNTIAWFDDISVVYY
jgi:hypothetical protein